MEPVLRRVVFRVGSSEYRWEDVARAAEFWGEWPAVRTRVALAAARLAELDEEADAASSDALDAAADEFRYARDLLTSEDLEAWLRHWNLSLDDWDAYLARSLLDPGSVENHRTQAAPDPAPDDLEQAVWTEVVCSGALAAWAERLATGAALSARWREEASENTGDSAHGREALSPVDKGAFERRLHEFERARERLAARHVTPRAIAEEIARRRADWTRVSGVLLTFTSRDAAREAALLGRDDGEPPAVVARLSGAGAQEGSFALEDFDGVIRERLRSVEPGTWAGPFETGDRFVLLFVRERMPPVATDPEIRGRAAEALLATFARQEVSQRVTWSQHA